MQSGILAWVTILRKKHYGSLHYFVFCLVYDWFKQNSDLTSTWVSVMARLEHFLQNWEFWILVY